MTKNITPESPTPEFSRIIEVDRLADGETSLSLEANAEERARLAKRLDCEDIHCLTAKLSIDYRKSKGDIRIEGRFHAEIVQPCVVTLAPVPATIDASVIRNFNIHLNDEDQGRDIDLNAIEDDEPSEPVKYGIIDAGEAVAEQLALEMDPFPRAPGAEFTGVSGDSHRDSQGKDRNSGPFAALARLKERSENKR
ncbi:MAG: DUF177 domain-containing protein [Rhodospirillales bacterium]